MAAVAKFQANRLTDRPHAVISRTFGKVAIVDGTWLRAMQGRMAPPRDGTFWLVDVVRDQAPGTNRGVLSVVPRYPLVFDECTRLFPGAYTEDVQDGVLYVRPKHAGPYWIASLALKDMLVVCHGRPHAVIVPIQPPADAAARALAASQARP